MNQYVRDEPYQALALDVSETGSRDPEAHRADPAHARRRAGAGAARNQRDHLGERRAALPFGRCQDPLLRACTSSAWPTKHERLIRDYVQRTPRALAAPVHAAPDLRQPLRLPLLVARAHELSRSSVGPRRSQWCGLGGRFFLAPIEAPHARGPATSRCYLSGVRHLALVTALLVPVAAAVPGARRLAGSSHRLERAGRTRRARAAGTPRRRRPGPAARQADGARRSDEAARAVSRARRTCVGRRRQGGVRAARCVRSPAAGAR